MPGCVGPRALVGGPRSPGVRRRLTARSVRARQPLMLGLPERHVLKVHGRGIGSHRLGRDKDESESAHIAGGCLCRAYAGLRADRSCAIRSLLLLGVREAGHSAYPCVAWCAKFRVVSRLRCWGRLCRVTNVAVDVLGLLTRRYAAARGRTPALAASVPPSGLAGSLGLLCQSLSPSLGATRSMRAAERVLSGAQLLQGNLLVASVVLLAKPARDEIGRPT